MRWLVQCALISFVFVFAQRCICACIIPRSRKWKMRCAEIATNNPPALSSTHSNCPSPIWQLPMWCIVVIMITCNHNSVLWDSTNRCIAIVIITAQLTVPAWLYSAHPPFLTQPFTSNYLPPLISTLCIFNNFSLRITLCLHSYIFTTIKLPPHIHILKNRVDNMHGTSNSRNPVIFVIQGLHNTQQGLQLASSLLELGWFLFAMLHLSVIPDAPCLCLGGSCLSCTTADCALLLFTMGLPWWLRF